MGHASSPSFSTVGPHSSLHCFAAFGGPPHEPSVALQFVPKSFGFWYGACYRILVDSLLLFDLRTSLRSPSNSYQTPPESGRGPPMDSADSGGFPCLTSARAVGRPIILANSAEIWYGSPL